MVQMTDFDTALHLEEQHKAEGEADGYRLALQSYLCEQSLSCCVTLKPALQVTMLAPCRASL